MKTKYAPKDLKCKINDTFFFWKQGFPKGGEGGGVRHWGNIPKKSRFFFWVASLTHLYFRILKRKFDCLIAVGVKKLGLDHIALLGERSRGNLSWAEGRENF